MPRISREKIKVREAFTINNFKAGMCLDAAQSALVTMYQHKMNPYRLKFLYDSVNDNGKPLDVVTAPTPSPNKTDQLSQDIIEMVENQKNTIESGLLPSVTIDYLRHENEKLRQEIDELRLKETYASEWKAEVKELEKKIDKLTKQLEEKEETISSLEDEESTTQTKLDEALVESFNNEKYSNLVQHICDARNMPMARVTEYLDREDYINAARLLTQ